MHSCSQPWSFSSHSSSSLINVAENPAFWTDPSETNFTNILFVVDLKKFNYISGFSRTVLWICGIWRSNTNVTNEQTSYPAALYNHKIRQSSENPGCRHHEPPHNHKRNCHDFLPQMIEIWVPPDSLPAPLYAKCTLCSVDIRADSLAIPVDCHFPM